MLVSILVVAAFLVTALYGVIATKSAALKGVKTKDMEKFIIEELDQQNKRYMK